jgi:hypothetical protein
LAIWKRVQLDAMSVRRFRAERTGTSSLPARSAARDVLLAARRLGRALKRLGVDGAHGDEAASLVRTLRRTQRLVTERIGELRAAR